MIAGFTCSVLEKTSQCQSFIYFGPVIFTMNDQRKKGNGKMREDNIQLTIYNICFYKEM